MRHYNIPVFVPHLGCPHDCVFCNQKRITGNEKPVDAKKIIDEFLDKAKPSGYVEIAFFGGSFTGIPFEEQCSFLSIAKKYIDSGQVDGIRLSTRPDYIDNKILDNLQEYGVTTIELGVQSLDEEVLKLSARGHTSDAVYNAVNLIRNYNFKLGLQMMTGLPGDTYEKSIETAVRIAKLKPDFVRIYPTLVIRDTYLEKMYNCGEYIPFSLNETVDLLAELKCIFDSSGIDIIRMGLQTTDEISPDASVVAGPFHESVGELVWNKYYLKIIEDICNDGGIYDVYCAGGHRSKVIGHKKNNVNYLQTKRNIKISVSDMPEIKPGELKIVEVKKDCF